MSEHTAGSSSNGANGGGNGGDARAHVYPANAAGGTGGSPGPTPPPGSPRADGSTGTTGSIDDPAMPGAVAPYRRHSQRSQAADIAATVVLLIVHAFLLGATIVLLSLLVMATDPCGSVKCGDPVWIDRAMRLGIWGGGAVLITGLVVAVYRLARGKLAFFIPIIGCAAQVALAVGAAVLEFRAGPV